MKKSAPTDTNRDAYYQHVYHMQKDSIDKLIDVSAIDNPILFIDCCGWHYRDLYPEKEIHSFETVNTAVTYKINRAKFNRLIDERTIPDIKWPRYNLQRCVLIFDRSPLLKYQTIEDFVKIINSAGAQYLAESIIIRGSLLFINDNRLVAERINNFSSLVFADFSIKYFLYDTENLQYKIVLKSK